jgi:alpha-L-fucosidase
LPGRNTTGFGGADISALPLESCETMNDAWGFNITDRNFKSYKQLIHYMVNAAGRNANFLLNVGPKPTGMIQQEFVDTLAKVGEWMKLNGRTVIGTRGNLVKAQDWGVVTGNQQNKFVHILDKKDNNNFVFIPKYTEKVTKASLYGKGTAVSFKQLPEGLFIFLEGIKLDDIDTIIQLN